MKRILFVVRDAAGWAGTERVLNLVASALSADHEVGVLSLSEERPCAYPYPGKVGLEWLPLPPSPVSANLAVARAIRRNCPEVLVLTGLGEIKYLLASLIVRRYRFLCWEHFNAAYTYRRMNRRFAARTADCIVTLTERDASDWKRLLAPRGRVAALSNPVPAFPTNPSSLDSPRILAAGRLERQKHFDLLVEAFALAAERLPGWSLRIRGSGSEEGLLRDKARELGVEDRVEILPPTRDMETEYAEASIYAMSSRFEGFPMVLLEAMAAGIPCVSVDCPNGPREIIADGEDGFVTAFGEALPLAEALARLGSDEALRKQMGRAAREDVKRFSIESVTSLWNDLLEPPR